MPDVPASSAAVPVGPCPLRISHHQPQPGWCVVEVEGEVDLASAPVLKGTLLGLFASGGYRRFVLDLSRVGHLDSTGLGVLVGFRQRLGEGGAVKLAGLQPNVLNVLQLAGLDRVFEVWPTADRGYAWDSVLTG